MIKANTILITFLMLYVLQSAFSLWIERLNLRNLERHGSQVPLPFRGVIDASALSRISAYTTARSRLGMAHEILSDLILLALILSGLLAVLGDAVHHLSLPYTVRGVLFFLIPGLILYAVELPFDYTRTFVIEERFGFNRSTLRTWAVDHLKSGAVSLLLGTLLLTILLLVIAYSPGRWWLWGFLVVSAIQILLAVVYPVLIAPLFNKFEPIRDAGLADRITCLMEENGIRVKRILQMDAGKRSRHTNAYFTGLGRTKQIVLFDTLLESHSQDEILSVLAHEVGHFRKRHIVKQLILFELLMFAGFYLTYRLLAWPQLTTAFGFTTFEPYLGLFLLGIFWQKAGFFLQPLYLAVSRHFEREADRFAVSFLRTAEPLMAALRRMAADNLSNLVPHPVYVRFHYSHPPLVERLARLEVEGRPYREAPEGAGGGVERC